MADLAAINLETGGTGEFTAIVGSPTIVSSPVHDGLYALQCPVNAYGRKTFAATGTLYARVYFRITKLPWKDSCCSSVIHFYAGATYEVDVMFRWDGGKQGVWVNTYGFGFASQDYDFHINTWYCLEMACYKAVSGWTKVWVNDVLIVNSPANTSGMSSCDEVQFGSCDVDGGYNGTTYIDCMGIATTGPIGTHRGFGFNAETGDFSQFDSMVGSPTIEALKRHCGNNGALATLTAYTSQGATVNLGQSKEVFLQFYLQIGTSPSTSKYVELARISRSTDDIMKIRLYNDAGNVKWGFFYRHAGSLLSAYSTTSMNPATATWIRVQVRIRCSTIDGDATGIYQMWVDGTELADISKSTRDTDYVAVSTLNMVATTDNPNATVYWDCLVWDSVAEASHAAGSTDTVTYSEPADCVPVGGRGWLQVWRNCQQIGIFSFELKQEQHGIGTMFLPRETDVVKNDLVHCFVQGTNLLQGKVTTIEPDRSKGLTKILIQTKSARLYTKRCLEPAHTVYSLVDAGYIVYDLISYYFNGLFTTNHINQATGVTIQNFDCTGKSVGEAIDELNGRANTCLYIDALNDTHYFVAGDESSGYTLNPEDVEWVKPVDLSPLCSRVIVKGNGCWGIAGSGLPEIYVEDRNISTSAEAQQIAEAKLALYGSGRLKRTEIHTKNFYALKQGMGLVLNYPKEGFENSIQTVQDVTYKFAPKGLSTTIFVGDSEPSLLWAFRKAIEQAAKQNVSRVSDHTGAAAVQTDPLLTYNDLLNLAAGSNTAVSDAGKTTVRTGTCGSETNPTSLVYVETALVYVSGAFTGVLDLEDSGGTIYDDWEITMDASITTRKKTCKLPFDLSGKTMYLKFICRVGDSGSLNATLKIRQFIQHAHSMSQSDNHEMD